MTKQAKIILFSCLYIVGILAYFTENIPFLFTLLSGILIFTVKRNYISVKYAVALSSVFIIGLLNTNFHINYTDDLTGFADNNNLKLTAKVISVPTNINRNKTKFYAKVISAKTDNENYDNLKAKTLVTINDDEDKYEKIKIGDTLLMEGSVRIPQPSKNPSQFDYARYLQFKNTFSLFYVNDNWEILSEANDTTGKILSRLNDTRNRILKIHSQNIKPPMIQVLGGIIFGDDAVNPDDDTKTSFINSGIFHILAASGMNVTLIFGIWFFIAKTIKLNHKFSIAIGILLILFYTCMTGFGPPIIRATIMLTLILIGRLLDRKTSTMALLFMVAFIMLLFSPLMLFDIGFQMSFLVTFALVLTSPLLNFNFKFKFLNYISGICIIPFIAQIFAAPLQMYYFNTFTMYSLFANILIVPVLSIVSFLGFISSLLAIFPYIANKVCIIADYILNPLLIYIVEIANFFSKLPNSVIYLKKPYLIQILLYFSIIILIIVMLRFKLKTKKHIFVVSSLILVFMCTFIQIQNKNPEIIFFSVENADAILIKSPQNEYFIIDSGKMPYKTSSSQAKNIIIKYLTDKGIKNINSYIITHFDSDHAGGTIDLINNLKIDKIYTIDNYENTLLARDIKEYFKSVNIFPITIKGILEIYKDNNFSINIFKPEGENIKTENQKSLITVLKYYNHSALFMGDGDIQSYNSIPDSLKENIIILKSGHHGAKDTIDEEIIKNTKLTVISTGKNIYNHPHPDTINILEANNKKYLRTDYCNAIKTILDKNSLKSYCYSPVSYKFILQTEQYLEK